jgi:hypothetical protein
MEQDRFVTTVHFNGSGLLPGLRQALDKLVRDESGRVLEVVPLMGDLNRDAIVICTFPSNEAALKAWAGIGTQYGWKTQTNYSPTEEVFEEISNSIRQSTTAKASSGTH